MRGAGERSRGCRDPQPHAVVLLPGGGGLSTAEVFAEADRLGLGRARGELEELAARLLRARPAPAPRRSPTPSSSSTTSSPPRAPCARRSVRPSTHCAAAGAPLALLSGSGPTAFGLFADLAAARAPRRERIDRDDAIVCAAGRGEAPVDEDAGRGGGGSRKRR